MKIILSKWNFFLAEIYFSMDHIDFSVPEFSFDSARISWISENVALVKGYSVSILFLDRGYLRLRLYSSTNFVPKNVVGYQSVLFETYSRETFPLILIELQ